MLYVCTSAMKGIERVMKVQDNMSENRTEGNHHRNVADVMSYPSQGQAWNDMYRRPWEAPVITLFGTSATLATGN